MVDAGRVKQGDFLVPSEYAIANRDDIRREHLKAFDFFLKNGGTVLASDGVRIRMNDYHNPDGSIVNLVLRGRWFEYGGDNPNEKDVMNMLF